MLGDSSFSFADRKEISKRTQGLPPDKLSLALGIIFGDEEVTRKGKEFTVDFGKLDDGVCYKLAGLIKSHDASARVGPSRPKVQPKVHPKVPAAVATKGPVPGRKRSSAEAALGAGGGADLAVAPPRSKARRTVAPADAGAGESMATAAKVPPRRGIRPLPPKAGAAEGGSRGRGPLGPLRGGASRSSTNVHSRITGGMSARRAPVDEPDHAGRLVVSFPQEDDGDELLGSVLAVKGARLLVLFDRGKELRWISNKPNRIMTQWRPATGFAAMALPVDDAELAELLDAERAAAADVSGDTCEAMLSVLFCLEAVDPFLYSPPCQGRGGSREETDPMSFHAVREKVANRAYKNAADFAMHVREVLAEIFEENDETTELGRMALILKCVFEGLWRVALETPADQSEDDAAEPARPRPTTSRKSAAAALPRKAGGGSGQRNRGTSAPAITRFREEMERSVRRAALGRSAPPPQSASHKNLHANLDERSVGRRIQVFWEGDNEWYPGLIEEYDTDTKQFRLRYRDGQEEWIDLHTEPFTFAVEEGTGKSPVLLLQRLGEVIVAKAEGSPWWPAEICLPCMDDLEDFEDVGAVEKRTGQPSETRFMVLYFGEDQYDVLPKEKIKTINPMWARKRLKPRGRDEALDAAWDLAAERAAYLGGPAWSEY